MGTSINFYLNNDRKSKNKELAIYCFIRDSGKTISLHANERIEKKFWDSKGQKAKRSYIGHPELNDYLYRFREKVKQVIRNAKIENPLMPFDQLKAYIIKEFKKKTDYNFFQILDVFIDTRKSTVSKATITRFHTFTKHLEDFSKTEQLDIALDTIDLTFFDKLQSFFISKNLSNNYIYKQMQFLISFLKWAYEREFTKNNKFEKYQNVKKTPSDQIALTKADLKKIMDAKNLGDKLEKVRDMFLFQLYTGQRYAEIAKFDIRDVHNGVWNLYQDKTKKKVEIPLISPALQIVAKHGNKLPIITNQKLNKYLKELGEKAGLDEIITVAKFSGGEKIEQKLPKYKLLCTHTARRTFVSLAGYSNINPDVVKSFTGHNTDKMVSVYFKKNTEDSRKAIEGIFSN